MVFTVLQNDNLSNTELNNLDYYTLLLTLPIESVFTETKEAFPFLNNKQIKQLEEVGAALVLSESKEEIELYYKQVPKLERETLPICVYYDKFNDVVKQK